MNQIYFYCFVIASTFLTLTTVFGEAAPQRRKHQFDFFDTVDAPFDNNFNPNAFAQMSRRRRPGGPGPGEPLIFSNTPKPAQFNPTTQPQSQPTSGTPNNNNNNNSNNNSGSNVVFINNRPTVATMAPFTDATTASPQFLACYGNCPTTSEYNPVCASNRQGYFNMQKFNCARSCGADIQIVRRGSCPVTLRG